MSLYDNVMPPFRCPYCKHTEKASRWQTHGLGDALATYKSGDYTGIWDTEIKEGAAKIYKSCDKCDKHVEAWVGITAGRVTANVDYSHRKVRYPRGGIRITKESFQRMHRLITKAEKRGGQQKSSDALKHMKIDYKPLSPEELKGIEQSLADIKAGRVHSLKKVAKKMGLK